VAFVIAELTDAQVALLFERGIPHRVIPADLVARFRTVVPPQMTSEDALERLIREAILNTEARNFANVAGQQLDQAVRAKRVQLAAELGL